MNSFLLLCDVFSFVFQEEIEDTKKTFQNYLTFSRSCFLPLLVAKQETTYSCYYQKEHFQRAIFNLQIHKLHFLPCVKFLCRSQLSNFHYPIPRHFISIVRGCILGSVNCLLNAINFAILTYQVVKSNTYTVSQNGFE